MEPKPTGLMSASEMLRRAVIVLFRRKQVASALFVAVIAASITLMLMAPKEYQSQMKLLLRNERADLLVSPERTAAAPTYGVTEAEINSEVELLTSTDTMRSVVREARLDSNEVSWDPDPKRRALILTEKALGRLQRGLSVTPVKKANVILVEYTASNPQLAAYVLRKLAEVYLDAHLRLHRSQRTSGFFQAQKTAYEQALREQEERLAALRRQNDAPMLAQQKEATLQAYSHMTSQLHETDASISQDERKAADLNQRLRSVEPRIVTQQRVAQNQGAVQTLTTALADLQNRRTELLAKFLPGDRLVVEAEEKIANTRAALDKAGRMTETERSTDVNPVRQRLEEELAKTELELAGLRARRQTLARQALESKARLSELSDATFSHDDLARKIRETEESYLLYARKEEEARIGDALDRQKIANVTVAEAPTEPALPSRPKRSAYLAVGLLLASFSAAAGAFTIEHFSDTVHTPAELEALSGLRVLATVPSERT